MQIRQNCNSFNLTLPIIEKAQQTLLSPQEFYQLCQEVSQVQKTNNLYFIITNPRDLLENKSRLTSEYVLKLFDCLALQIKKNTSNFSQKFYLQKVLIKLKKSQLYTFRTWCITRSVPQSKLEKNSRKPLSNTFGSNKLGTPVGNSFSPPIKVHVEIAGEGMIGRVAKVKINEGEDLALKVFFDSSLVWQHGPWGEIPVAIYLQAHQVTKNIPQFKFASQSWAVWEWIYPETKPDYRAGITYEEFANKQGLTSLNYLNCNNYNPYQIRLDLGGIQKEYSGRRWHDFLISIIFYKIKLRQEGLKFFQRYLTWKNIGYFTLRLISLIFSNFNKAKINERLRINGHY